MFKLLLLPLLYWLLDGQEVLQGFALGGLSVALFMEIREYGVKALILRPGDTVINQVFTMIEAGDLDGLKMLTKKMPPSDLVSMRRMGL